MPPKPPPPKGKRRGKGRRDDDEYGGFGGREQKLSKPPDQENLTETQLKEEIQRVLVTTDPTIMWDRVIWDFAEREFVVVPVQDETITLFHMDAELIPKDQVEEFKKVYPYALVDVDVEYPEIKEEKKAPPPIAAAPAAAPAEAAPPAAATPAPADEKGGEHRPSMDGEGEVEEKKSETK